MGHSSESIQSVFVILIIKIFCRLPLRLINKQARSIGKQTRKSLFYRLDETIAARLHPTSYDPHLFRLACVLVENNTIQWDTLCLSDYIRPSRITDKTANDKISIQFVLEQYCRHKYPTVTDQN